jgi:hypothetical protein
LAGAIAYSLDRRILYVGRSNGMICQIGINNKEQNCLLTRILERKFDNIATFINFDAIVPFLGTDSEYLLTIRSYLDLNETPKAMLNIYDVDNALMISNENNSVPKNNVTFTEVNDACLIDSGLEKFSAIKVFALATKIGISFVTLDIFKDSGASKF